MERHILPSGSSDASSSGLLDKGWMEMGLRRARISERRLHKREHLGILEGETTRWHICVCWVVLSGGYWRRLPLDLEGGRLKSRARNIELLCKRAEAWRRTALCHRILLERAIISP